MAIENKPFHVYWLNEVILVFKFDNLSTTASKMWADHCIKYDDQTPDPLRMLYDFVNCGPPSPYWIKNQNIVIPKLHLPENKRNAYLVADDNYRVWTETMLNRIPVDVGPLKTFTDKDKAIAWLMEDI